VGEALVRGLAFGALYGILAASLALVFRATRSLSFAHGEIGALGLFVAWWLVEDAGAPWLAGAVAGITAAAAVGVGFHAGVARHLLGAPVLGLSVATTGLLLALIAIEIKIWGVSPRSLRPPFEALGPRVLGHHLGPAALLGLGAAAIVGVILPLVLRRTDGGLALAAVSHDPEEARATGISVARVSVAVWAGSSALAAVAALLLAPLLGGFAPGSMTLFFVRALAAAVIGGLGRIGGALAGGLLVGVVEQSAGHLFVTSSFPGVEAVSVLALVVVALLARPRSVFAEAA
jgi:branched-chain amino acid transport system permease protein